jgi:hypothetical protein
VLAVVDDIDGHKKHEETQKLFVPFSAFVEMVPDPTINLHVQRCNSPAPKKSQVAKNRG